MSTSKKKPNTPKNLPDQSPVLLLLGDIADTTWRMFVPTLGLGALGFWLDGLWQTMPWLAISGVILGATAAGFLVKQQMSKIKL